MRNPNFGRFLGVIFALTAPLAWGAAQGVHPMAEIEAARLKNALTILGATKSGKAELELAKSLDIPIQSAKISKTDITATRTVTSKGEKFSYQVQVWVAKDKSPVFQALDLAHELVHATHPKKNPFDPNLSAVDYIRYGIEGEGGEAKAIQQECQVGQELIDLAQTTHDLKDETVRLIQTRCQFVWDTEANAAKWTQSFYQLGQYYQQFVSMISRTDEDLKVSAKSPIFSSAVAHEPYPLALLEEYIDVTRRLCARNRKIASEALSELADRCRSVGAAGVDTVGVD